MTDEGSGAPARLEERRRHELVVEVLAAVLLALSAVATAWSSYQAARWSGIQANSYAAANAARLESTRASTRAGQLAQIDVSTFISWAEAYSDGNRRLERFLYQRFRPPMKRAATAWLLTRPLKNPDAPPTPFAMPQYRLPEQDQADRELARAEAASATAREANQRSDDYVLAVVLFASVLFFAGIASKFSDRRVRLVLVAAGGVILLGTAAWIGTFPVSVAV